MKATKLFILSSMALIIFSFASSPSTSSISNCESLDFKYDVTEKTDKGIVDLEIIPSGGAQPYKIIFYTLGDKKTLISQDFSVSKFKNIEKGKYYCIVVDKNDCKTEKTIELK